MRWFLAACVVMAGGCGGSSPTPTSPSAGEPPVFSAVLSCAPADGARVHRVPISGTPLVAEVWIDQVAPARGTTIVPGEWYTLQHRSTTPPGYTIVVQPFVSAHPSRGGFFASAGSGCGTGGLTLRFPSDAEPLQVHLRAWVVPGRPSPDDLLRLLQRAPDYEGSEPLPWVVGR